MEETFEQLLEILKAKAEALADALNHESGLEDDRAAIKADAITRIMKRDSIAATPAEKIVETDEEYFKHRAAQRASVVTRFRAEAEYEAAKATATRASLITPSMIELQTKISVLEKALKQAKRDVDIREVATRRANSMLADRIRDVEELQKELRALRGPAGSGQESMLRPTTDGIREDSGFLVPPQFASDPRD